MEVSPGTITIDSISAMEAPLSGTETNRTPQPTAASNRDNSSSTQNEPSSGSSTTRGPMPNVPTFTGQGHPMLNIPFRNLIPVPLTSMGSLHAFDSGLPCHSVWALEPSRRRHNAGGSRTPAAVQIGVTPNVPGRQEDQLQQVINNIMMSLLNHPNVPAQGFAPGTPLPPTPPPGFTLFPSATADDTQRRRFFMDSSASHRNRDNSARTENSASQMNSSPELFTIPLPGRFEYDYETFESLFQLLTETDGPPPTIAEELAGFFNVRVDRHKPGVVEKLMWFLARHLSFKDVLDIHMGKYDSLDNIREPLQVYVRENICDWTGEQTEKVIDLTSQILNECGLLQEVESKMDIHEGIDYNDELIAFMKNVVREFLDAVLKPRSSGEGWSNFGKNFWGTCEKLFKDFLALNDRCTNNGNSVAETVILEAIAAQCDGLSDRLSLLIQSLSTRIIRDLFHNKHQETQSCDNGAAKNQVPNAATGSASVERKTSSARGNLPSDSSFKQAKRNATSPEESSASNKKGKELTSNGVSENTVSSTLP
ncbi:hypothetical protein X975_03675, partial [Stegodyphus mimosarum]